MENEILDYCCLIKYLSEEAVLKIFKTNITNIHLEGNRIKKDSRKKYGSKYRKKKNGFWVDFELNSINIIDIKLWLESLNCKYDHLSKVKRNFISDNRSKEWDFVENFKLVISIFNKVLTKYVHFKIIKTDATFESRSELILSYKGDFEHRLNKYLLCYFQIANSKDELLDTICICISEKSKVDDIKDDITNSIDNLILAKSLPEFDLSNLLLKFKKAVTCVATPLFSGRLIHESIGHYTEADVFELSKSRYDYLGKLICNSEVTIIDFANGKNVPNNYYIDEEGSYSHNVTLINKGVLSGILSDEEYNITKYHKVAGVVRSYEDAAYPLIRMRNTALLPGKYEPREVMESVRDGILLNEYSDGCTDIHGNFVVQAKMCVLLRMAD